MGTTNQEKQAKSQRKRNLRNGLHLLKYAYVPPGTHVGFGEGVPGAEHSLAFWQDAVCTCGNYIDTSSCRSGLHAFGQWYSERDTPYLSDFGQWSAVINPKVSIRLPKPRTFICEECGTHFDFEYRLIPLTESTTQQQVREAASTWTPVTETNLRERKQAMRTLTLYRVLRVPVLWLALIIVWVLSKYVFPLGEFNDFNGYLLVGGGLAVIVAYFILTRGALRSWLSRYLARREVWLAPQLVGAAKRDENLYAPRQPNAYFNERNPDNSWRQRAKRNAVPITPVEP